MIVTNNLISVIAINFAQYIAEEHYRLVNVENNICYWQDEKGLKTTEELFKDFIKANNDRRELRNTIG
jgi:hypothetical protein